VSKTNRATGRARNFKVIFLCRFVLCTCRAAVVVAVVGVGVAAGVGIVVAAVLVFPVTAVAATADTKCQSCAARKQTSAVLATLPLATFRSPLAASSSTTCRLLLVLHSQPQQHEAYFRF